MRDSYESDEPLVEPQRDEFQRVAFAKRIAETLSRREDPSGITVAINGVWGEGKTTVLHYIESELRHLPGVVSVRFNPWHFTDETALFGSFFTTLAMVLETTIVKPKERIGALLREYGALASLASFEVQGVKFSAASAVENFGWAISTVTLEERKRQVEQALIGEGRRIVILINDIDRLDKKEVHALFRLIKFAADFPYTSYVLAFDPDVISEALAEAFGKSQDAGRRFLEKIIQVPLNLPTADPRVLRELCLERVYRILQKSGIDITPEFDRDLQMNFLLKFSPGLDTPRTSKRFANSLAFTLPLLVGEVHPLDIILMEGLKVFYPTVYAGIRKAPSNFTGTQGELAFEDLGKPSLDFIESILRDLDGARRDGARRLLLEIFPQLTDLFQGKRFGPYRERVWSKDQRVASGEYLLRYLTCSVPRGDVPDTKLTEMLRDIETIPAAVADERFKQWLDSDHVHSFIDKLALRAGDMEAPIAGLLALIAARNGHLIPLETSEIAFLRPNHRMALVIHALLRRVTEAQMRTQLAHEIVNVAQPLPFAHLCFSSALQPDRNDTAENWLSTVELDEIAGQFAVRIATHAAANSLVDAFPGDFLWLMLHWSKTLGQEPVHAHSSRILEANPHAAIPLLKAPFLVGPYTGNDFVARHYEDLERIANPGDVYRALRRLESDPAVALAGYEAEVARQFSELHLKTENPADSGV